MSRPKFTVSSYKDKYVNLYALKKRGNTILQIEDRKNQILIYPHCKDILFIHKGKMEDLPEEKE